MKKWMCLLLCLTVLGGSGCGTAANSAKETQKTENIELKAVSDEACIVTHRSVDGIRFYDVAPRDSQEKRPIVFFFHGLRGNKARVFSHAKKIAEAGYVVVVPDCAGHGENKTKAPMNLCRMIEKTKENCDEILAYYETSKTADNSRFSVMGFSMGGMTSLYYGAYAEERPECVVSLYATPDWESMLGTKLGYVIAENGEFRIAEEEKEREEIIRSLIEASPDKDMEHLLELPILMINGDKDSRIPVTGVKAFGAKASLYPNQLELIVQEGRTHKADKEDITYALAFIKKHMPVKD